jgi:ubiquitin-protein ligase
MQSYIQPIQYCSFNDALTSYIINKCVNFSSYEINKDNVKLLYKNQNNKYIIEITKEGKKPILINSDINLDNKNETIDNLYTEICKKIEKINLTIENFEDVLDIIYDLNLYINKKKIELNKEEPTIIKDNIKLKRTIEHLKHEERAKKKSVPQNGIFTFDSCLEMLGDQLLKINNEKNFQVDIINLFQINIKLTNFKFNNPEMIKNNKNIYIHILMVINPEKIMTEAPEIQLTSNIVFKYNLLQSIEKLKPFVNKNTWSIKYSFYDIIVNIYNMVNQIGEIETINSNNKLESIINDLEYLLSLKTKNISENKLLEIFDKQLLSQPLINQSFNSTNNSTYWKKGTGYGHSSSSTWNIDDYVNSLKLKRKNINDKMIELLTILNSESNFEVYIDTIMNLYKSYLTDDEVDNKIVLDISHFIAKYHKLTIPHLSIIKTIKDFLDDNNISSSHMDIIFNNKQIILPIISDNLTPYQTKFNKYKFQFYNSKFNNMSFIENENIPSALSNQQMSKLQKEFKILKNSIILSQDASIFFMVEKDNIHKMRFIISGPKNTPYEYGLFIFNMTIPVNYPTRPPFVKLFNTGGKRFNPNLYDSGKVCLSLLGTWKGDKGESWNSETSTFYQLLISIQSQILIDEPYFNEPGYEKYIGTPTGINNSKAYNDNLYQYTIDHAMIDLLSNNNESLLEFKEVINEYFTYHKDNIINTMNIWLERLPQNKKSSFSNSLNKLKVLLKF